MSQVIPQHHSAGPPGTELNPGQAVGSQDLFHGELQRVVRLSTRQPLSSFTGSQTQSQSKHLDVPQLIREAPTTCRQHLAGVCQLGMCLPDFKPTCLTKQPLLSNTCEFPRVRPLPRRPAVQRPARFLTLLCFFLEGSIWFPQKARAFFTALDCIHNTAGLVCDFWILLWDIAAGFVLKSLVQSGKKKNIWQPWILQVVPL